VSRRRVIASTIPPSTSALPFASSARPSGARIRPSSPIASWIAGAVASVRTAVMTTNGPGARHSSNFARTP
jgi:hypothetical protein